MCSLIIFFFATSVSFAQTPPIPSVTVQQSDWLSTLAVQQYGEMGLIYTPYLCKYNQQHGSIASHNCDLIRPGDKIYLPLESEMYCTATASLGYPCKIEPGSTVEKASDLNLLGALPQEVQACTLVLEAYDPTDDGSIGFNVTRAKQLAIASEDKAGITTRDNTRTAHLPGYLELCKQVGESPEIRARMIQPTEKDYWTMDENGQAMFVDHFGPEDIAVERSHVTTPPMMDPAVIDSCTHEVRSDTKRQVLDQCAKAPTLSTHIDCAYYALSPTNIIRYDCKIIH